MKKKLLITAFICICFSAFAADGENMNDRMNNFFAKIRRGEPVTVVTLGGSITTGYNAKNPAADGWAGLTGKWLKEFAAQNNSKLTFYNRGTSGTDSAFAIARLENHVLSLNPDLVILEFAMNDQWLEEKVRQRTYEAIIRKVMEGKDTAMLVLFVNERKAPYPSAQPVQEPICRHYGIPFVSWKDCLKADGKTSDFEAFFDGTETIHPNNKGHENIAFYIKASIEEMWKNLPSDSNILPVNKELPDPYSDADFVNAKYYHKDNLKPVLNEGWSEGSPVHNEWQVHGNAHKGWETAVSDGEIVFEVKGSCIGVTYAESDQFRNAVAWVEKPDGTVTQKVNLMCYVSYRNGYYGWAYKELLNTDNSDTYKVHIKASKNGSKAQEGKKCNITGILVCD